MKCRKCGLKASVNMRQHKLALCKDHYLEWIPGQTERIINKYDMFTRNEKILVAVSGGKDSLALWDILSLLDYRVDGLYIDLGIEGESISGEDGGYSAQSKEVTQIFAAERNLELHIVDVEKEYGQPISVLSEMTHRGKGRPCSICGLTKRHIMNRVARDQNYAVLATGHNLDDEVAVLFGNTLNWLGEYLLRQNPVLPESPGLIRKVKPLCRFYEREMAAYAILRGIEYIYEECPFAVGSKTIYYKELLNQLETERPGAKLTFYLRFLEARKEGLFAKKEDIQAPLKPCQNCGQPTSAPDVCSFCRLMNRAVVASSNS